MATINGMTLTQWDDLIDSEYISRRVRYAVDTPKTYRFIANVIDISGAPTRTYAHPLQSHLTAATAVSETDEDATANVTSTEATISATRVMRSTFVSRQTAGASVWSTSDAAIDAVSRACQLYIDDAFHGLSASASNTIGDNATTMDLDNWVTMLSTFAGNAKNAMGQRVFVCAVDGLRDLQQEIMTSAAAILGSSEAASQLFGGAASASAMGVQFMIGNVAVVSTDEIPAADTTGWGNYLTTTGADGGLGLVVKEGIRVDTTPWPLRQGMYFVGSADVGVGILEQAQLLEVISKT